MALTDLRGREHEPEVCALLELANAPPAPGWIVVGWRENGALVGCAALERVTPAELALWLITVALIIFYKSV